MNNDAKKVKPFPVKILFGILACFFSLIIMLAAWILYSALDKISPLKFIPQNYVAVIHTDKAYSAVEPLIGLKAAETVLSDPSFSSAREPYMKARTIINRANPLVKKLINRRVDTAIYIEENEKTEFISVIDLGWLSFATRLSPLASGFLRVKNLTWGDGHFEYKTENATIMARPFKNILMVTSSKKFFELSSKNFSLRAITKSEKTQIEETEIKDFKILAPSMKIAKMKAFDFFYDENSEKENAEKILGKENLSAITFSITNEAINVKLDIPINRKECKDEISELLTVNSKQPRFQSFFTSDTQYYTLMNIASLERMKNAFFPLIQKKSDIQSAWNKANGLCMTFFSMNLEELLFSWTGNEIAAFGIEGSSDPVFALQITDEKKRTEVFNKLNDSILINTNTNLIVNGMRLPCLEVPDFLSGLLSIFGVNLPRPFFLVNEGYIYFSMSPQNLSSIYMHINKNYVISRNPNWKNVSKDASSKTSLELYYNLKRSLPFFLDNASLTAKILKHYGTGRFDVEITDDGIQSRLHANANVQEESRMLSGFPKATGKISDYNLVADDDNEPENLYWIEEESKLKCLNLNSLEQKELNVFNEKIYIASTNKMAGKNNTIWVSTESGAIYILNNELKIEKEIHTDTNFSAGGVSYKDSYAVPTKNGSIIFAYPDGNIEEVFINSDANFKSRPCVHEDYMAIYSRSFDGEIYLLKDKECINKNNPMIIDGIGFGSPAIAKIDGEIAVAFITQKGNFFLFIDGMLQDEFPMETGKVFDTNVISGKNAFYSISEDAMLYKLNADATYSSVKIPDIESAREAHICSKLFAGKEGIYASGDSNVIYGFNPELELLMSFPVAGRGIPVFADVNKDKKINCIVLSISREINSWRMIQE